MSAFNHDGVIERVRAPVALDYDTPRTHVRPKQNRLAVLWAGPGNTGDPEMAFRFKLNDTLDEGARRVALEQIARARSALDTGVEGASAVHESRKCLKRCRALLRLVRPGIGHRNFRTLNHLLRSIAAELSPARDAEILGDTLTKLIPHAPPEAEAALQRLRSALDKDQKPAKSASAATTRRAIAGLDAAAHAFTNLKFKRGNFAHVEEGLAAEMRNARRQFIRAYAGDSEEAFHDWRKAAQRHWRHMQLLVRAAPSTFEARIDLARELSQVLGENQDLAILRARVAALPKEVLDPLDAHQIIELIEDREHALRVAAAPLGAKLFAGRPGRFATRTRAIWTAAARRDKRIRKATPNATVSV